MTEKEKEEKQRKKEPSYCRVQAQRQAHGNIEDRGVLTIGVQHYESDVHEDVPFKGKKNYWIIPKTSLPYKSKAIGTAIRMDSPLFDETLN